MLKSNLRTVLGYGCGIVFYELIFIWIYPSIAKSAALNTLLKSLPQGWVNLVGYQSGVTNVSDFLAGEFYGLIYIIIMAIFTVVTATKLVAHMVDNGSLAYLLATPVARGNIARTQAALLGLGILFIGALSTLGGLLGVHLFLHDTHLNPLHFIELNVVGALLFLVIGGYSFIFSCLAKDERTALRASVILTLAFYLLNTVAKLSHMFSWLNHVTIFAAFNAQNLIHGSGDFSAIASGLAGASIACFAIAIVGFRKRQMSL